MSVTFCFWALLSLDNFEFVYLPSFIKDTEIATGITVGNVLLSHSLLEFIHPDELSLATTDLLNFVRIKTLAGAITRCRLRRIKSLVASDSLKNEDWKVTDVVMYTAANKTILTFFHTHQVEQENTNTYTSTPYRSSCYYNAPLHENEAAIISETLQKYSLPLTIEDPFRLFQIYNTEDKKLLFQWPTYTTFNEHLDSFSSADSNKDREKCFESIIQYATNLSVEEIDRQTQNTQFRSGTDCTHHSHSNSVAFLEPCGVCQIEKIIITYGSLTFSSFQFTPIDNHFYHQHLNRIPSSTSSTDKQMTNQSTTNNNYEKFMKSFMGDNTSPVHVSLPPIATSPVKESKSSPRSTTSSQETVPKKTESEEKKPPSKSSSSNKLTLPKAWKSRFGITEKKCENCSTNKSPEWRRGPTGHKTLCNACGLRYARLVAKQEKKKSKSDDDEKYKP